MTSPRRLAVAAGLALVLTTGCSPASHHTSAPPAKQHAGVDSGPRLNAALLAAVTYVRLWSRPTLTRDAWYAGVRPVVTRAYAQLLADVDPDHVPAHGVTGSPHLVSAVPAVVVADVPTDAGFIQVTVTDTGGRWLIASASQTTSP
ncbi:hypothetical protein [Actinoplanes sp. NPDC051851]|uniref:hypothetical protein n=1 Tax=Actinoplanes sp. NPDC051851 TaxID=3154753 RepID=UPI003416694A